MTDPLTPDEVARLRQLIAVAPALISIGTEFAALEQHAGAANANPPAGLARVADDGAILYPIACARRVADISAGAEPPTCAWVPSEKVEGASRCRVCGRVEAGGERASILQRIHGGG